MRVLRAAWRTVAALEDATKEASGIQVRVIGHDGKVVDYRGFYDSDSRVITTSDGRRVYPSTSDRIEVGEAVIPAEVLLGLTLLALIVAVIGAIALVISAVFGILAWVVRAVGVTPVVVAVSLLAVAITWFLMANRQKWQSPERVRADRK